VEFLTDPWTALLGWEEHLHWGILPLRIALGWVFLYSGAKKFRGGIRGTGEWMKGLGLPLPHALAVWTASLEVAGGAMLLTGLLVHWVSIPLALNMLGAAWTQKARLNAPFSGGDVQGYELDVLMAAGAASLILLGAGPLSLDALLRG
jgi:putative oxidoreductase